MSAHSGPTHTLALVAQHLHEGGAASFRARVEVSDPGGFPELKAQGRALALQPAHERSLEAIPPASSDPVPQALAAVAKPLVDYLGAKQPFDFDYAFAGWVEIRLDPSTGALVLAHEGEFLLNPAESLQHVSISPGHAAYSAMNHLIEHSGSRFAPGALILRDDEIRVERNPNGELSMRVQGGGDLDLARVALECGNRSQLQSIFDGVRDGDRESFLKLEGADRSGATHPSRIQIERHRGGELRMVLVVAEHPWESHPTSSLTPGSLERPLALTRNEIDQDEDLQEDLGPLVSSLLHASLSREVRDPGVGSPLARPRPRM